MKKLNFTLFGMFLVSMAQAQIEKGDVLLGGNFGVSFQQSSSNLRSSNSNLQPFVQFAYKKNRTVGFSFDLSYSSNSSNDGQNKQQNFSFGPAINFTQFHPIKGAFGWWLQQEAGARFGSTKNSSGNEEIKTNSTTVFANVTPGLYYAVGEQKNWLLTVSVGGIGGSYFGNNGEDRWSIGTDLFQFYRFGFAYVFKK